MSSNQPTAPDCYGKMFPDLTRAEDNVPCKGKAFVVELRSQGLGVQSCELKTDQKGWEACVACPAYRTCYDLCMAKLALRQAMASL